MRERKKYYLLASNVFDALYGSYGIGNVELQKMPSKGSRKIAPIKIGEQELFLSVQHIRSNAMCFISDRKLEEFEYPRHEIISLHAGFSAANKLSPIWWIESGDKHASLSGITTFLNWAKDSAIKKLELYMIFYGVILELLRNEKELYETTTDTIPECILPSFLPEIIEK